MPRKRKTELERLTKQAAAYDQMDKKKKDANKAGKPRARTKVYESEESSDPPRKKETKEAEQDPSGSRKRSGEEKSKKAEQSDSRRKKSKQTESRSHRQKETKESKEPEGSSHHQKETKESKQTKNDPKAQKLFKECFPNGYVVIPTSGEGLLCSLYAISESIKAQLPDINKETPLKEVLMEITNENVNDLKKMGRKNEDNFYIDQLAYILEKWGFVAGYKVRLGYLLTDGRAFLVPACHDPRS